MKGILVGVCILLLLLPLAAATTLETEFTLSANDIATEAVMLTIGADQAYDSFVFTVPSEPLSVVYDGSYSVSEQNGSYAIAFAKDIIPGENIIRFKLLFDNLVQRSGNNRIFRTEISSAMADKIKISAKLPAGFMLSEQEPQATPAPDILSTDGRQIKLEWSFSSADAAVAVFYTDGKGFNALIYIIPSALIAVIVIGFFYFHRRRVRSIVTDTLSEDEQRVIELVRQGTTKQKEIAQSLQFSKSKMSKVMRKLEEKELIEKSPFFKTNIIKLKKI